MIDFVLLSFLVMEYVGAVAAGLQLTKAVVALLDIYKKAQDGPDTVRKQLLHVDQLMSLSSLVIQNIELQTESVARVLGTCMGLVRDIHRELSRTLFSASDGALRRITKALVSVMKSKDVGKQYSQLEKAKSTLALCIAEIDSYVLSQAETMNKI